MRVHIEQLEEAVNNRLNWSRNGFVYLLILVAAAALFFSMFPHSPQAPQADISQVARWVKQGRVERIVIKGDELDVHLKGEKQATISRKERGKDTISLLKDYGVSPQDLQHVKIEVEAPSQFGNWLLILTNLLPILIVGFLFLLLLRQAQGSNSQAMSFGKSRARMYVGDKPTVTFDDVAGAEEAKQELQEVVEFLREPQKFAALGARIPKGVLLIGPPGTGKTLMAKAIAGEAGVPFFSISGSEFVEMFVGVGASRVRDLFDQAKRNAPCIIFIDEIDAVGRHRGAGLGGSHDEREQTLNQILVEMDGFDTNTNVIVIAATNRPDILDPALLRPGRFDRRVVMDRPDMRGRRAILEVHVRGKPLAPDVDLDTIARLTPGFVGADLENLVNEAAILAARRNKRSIGMDEFTEAIERVALGPERRSRVISPEEKRIVAYHEAGHAIVTHICEHTPPVHKVSIIPRGAAGGYTLSLPEDDRMFVKRAEFMDQIAVALGGRAAEELAFGDMTDGAVSDLEKATKMARAMVTRYGMSDRLGPMVFGKRDELVFLGKEIGEQRNYSEEVAEQIDEEIQRIVRTAYAKAKDILTRYRNKLDEVAQLLLDKETLEREEFESLFRDVDASANATVPAPSPAPA